MENMGTYLNSSKERLDLIMSITEAFFSGAQPEELKSRFQQELGGKISAGEFALSEQLIEDKGVSDKQFELKIDDLIDIFKPGLEKVEITGLPLGHPLDSFIKENVAIMALLKELRDASKSIDINNIDLDFWNDAYAKIWQIDAHYIRKENQLFPYLEKKKFYKPSKVMWTIHDTIRSVIKHNRSLLEEGKYQELFDQQEKMFSMIENMVFKEDKILWATSLELLFDEEWREIKAGEDETEYCLIETPPQWGD